MISCFEPFFLAFVIFLISPVYKWKMVSQGKGASTL